MWKNIWKGIRIALAWFGIVLCGIIYYVIKLILSPISIAFAVVDELQEDVFYEYYEDWNELPEENKNECREWWKQLYEMTEEERFKHWDICKFRKKK